VVVGTAADSREQHLLQTNVRVFNGVLAHRMRRHAARVESLLR
jgi:hypothetical protein